MEILYVALLTVIGSAVGTLTGFGTSTVMVPIMLLWFPLTTTLFLVGIIHWFVDIWKISLFRKGLDLKLVLLFGVPGIALAWLGAELVFHAPEELLSRVLGAFLIVYTLFVLFNPCAKMRKNTTTAVTGGGLYGFFAGIFGVGGAIRTAFLSAFNLPKAVFIATSGAIALMVDTVRLSTYWYDGATIGMFPYWSLLVFIASSLMGAYGAKRVVNKIPQNMFRSVVMVFLFLVAVKLFLWP